MKLIEGGVGIYARPQWLTRSKPLVIVVHYTGTYYVCVDDDNICEVRAASTSYKYDDFKPVSYSKLVEKIYKKFNKFLGVDSMAPEVNDVKVVVLSSNGVSAMFTSEEEALNYVVDCVEDDNKTQHVMFKPYQKVVPKRADISSLIVKLD